MAENLFEAFHELDSLNEEVFDLNNDGIEELKKFRDGDMIEFSEIVIDPMVSESDLNTDVEDVEHVDDVILNCVVCQSKIFKPKSEVYINEEQTLANVGDECPLCHSIDGYKIIGQVEKFDDSEETEEKVETEEEPAEEVETEVEEKEEIEESLKESSERDDIDADADDKKERIKKALKRRLDDADSLRDERRKSAKAKFRKAQDDIDADRDDKLERKGLRESTESTCKDEEKAKRLVKKYYNHEFDLDTLHRELRKLFNSNKDAVEWLADNDEKIKNLRENKKLDEGFRGCKKVRMIWHGEWSDPELYYKDEDGKEYFANYYDVEDSMWNYYQEEAEYAKKNNDKYAKELNSKYDWSSLNEKDDTDFNKFIVDNENSVIEDVIEFSESNNYDHSEEIDESCKSVKESVTPRDDIDAEADNKKELAKKRFMRAKDDADADKDYRLKKAGLKESDKPAATSIEDAQKWVDYDMKKYGKISERTNRLVRKAGFQIVKDTYGDYEVIAGDYERKEESLKEDTVKQGNYWVNKGEEGTHGKFKTKKAADEQRKAMFARGFKEELEEVSLEDMIKDDKYSLEDCMEVYLDEYEDYDIMTEDDLLDTIDDLSKGDAEERAQARRLRKLFRNSGEDVKYFDYENEKPITSKEFLKQRLEIKESLKENSEKVIIVRIDGDLYTIPEDEYELYKQSKVMNGRWLNWTKSGFDTAEEVIEYNKKYGNKDANYEIIDEKLIQGKSDETVRKNTETEIKAGKDPKQAYAIAKSIQRKNMKEDFERVDIETDRERMTMTAEEGGKVTVTTEPKESMEKKEDEEIKIVPISKETSDELLANKEEEDGFEDIEIDEFDEEEFDRLGEGFLKRVYENVDSYKTTKGSTNEKQIKLEGIITFKSGKKAKTNFVFEAKTVRNGKVKLFGENLQFTKGKKAFVLTGGVNNGKLVCESLSYNYKGKDAKTGNTKRLCGTIGK